MPDTAPPARPDHAAQVLDYFRLVDAGDLPAVFALFDDDIVYRRPGVPALEGKAAVVEFFRTARGIARSAHTVEVVAVDGDRVVIEGHLDAELHDGRRLEVRFADVFWFSGGLVRRRHGYVDRPLAEPTAHDTDHMQQER